MNKNILLIIFGLAIIAYGVYALISNNQEESNISLNSNQDNTYQEQTGENIIEGQLVNQMDNIEPLVVADGSYLVSQDESDVYWQAAKVLAGHTGDVIIKSGEFRIENGELVSGNVTIDMTSITSDEGIDSLVTHLKSDDFFNVNIYPEANLEITNITKLESSASYKATGNMTIKGITQEITIPLNLEAEDNKVIVNSNFAIDRTRWEINFRSGKFFQDLGDNMIKDEINFQVRLVGVLNS
jgi:polyisoprenoid-binding protein YceI